MTAIPDDATWSPPQRLVDECSLTSFMQWLAREQGQDFAGDYRSLWAWSTTELDEFWRSVWSYFELGGRRGPEAILTREQMPGAVWCPDERINYAEELLKRRDHSSDDALLCVDESATIRRVSWDELRSMVGALADHLRRLGVAPGDRVVGYLPNREEAIVGLLASASVGAIWSVCAPDYGTGGVISRFAQLAPKVLIATTGYRFGGRTYDRRKATEQLVDALPSVEQVIWVDSANLGALSVRRASASWDEVLEASAPLVFEQVAFDHPLWVLFSSGTTGTPKGITQGHGGILLEHFKSLGLQGDVRPGDRYMLLGSTSWMVWNILVASLLVGATAVLLDGNPVYPSLERVWETADQVEATTIGFGAGFLHACAKAELRPRKTYRLASLRAVVSTGSPLSLNGHRWVRDALGEEIWLSSTSGGTDVCSAFVAGCPLLPLRPGRIQAPCLGVAVEAWDADGQRLIGQTGELVVRRPMPSMPLFFWGDADGERYHDSYFSTYPGIWRHGDFIEFDDDGSAIIAGRSDSTLNRKGVRFGSADIYQVVEALPEVREALVVGAELSAEEYYMPLFVELAAGQSLDECRETIIAAIRRDLSPRHVPDAVISVPGIPHTKTGKKLEVPIKRLLQGASVAQVADADVIDRPELLETLAELASGARKPAAQHSV